MIKKKSIDIEQYLFCEGIGSLLSKYFQQNLE